GVVATRGLRDRAVFRPDRGRAHSPQPAPAVRRRPLPPGARGGSRWRAVRRLGEPPRAFRRYVRVPGGDQGGPAARARRDAGAGGSAAQRDPPGARRARAAHDRTAAERRAGATVWAELTAPSFPSSSAPPASARPQSPSRGGSSKPSWPSPRTRGRYTGVSTSAPRSPTRRSSPAYRISG